MKEAQARETKMQAAGRGWSNRILILAAAGILFLTLYPFEFSLHTRLPVGASPFFLGRGDKGGGARDIILNILLFMPFGFALGTKLRRKSKSWLAALVWTWGAGALLSYGIEFLQIYIPARDSGWEDVLTNSTGSAIGFLAFELLGSPVLKLLSQWERSLEGWLTVGRAALILLFYFGAWLLSSIPLQNQTHLGNWSPNCFLVIGNDATGRHPWKGKVSRLEIWDRGLGKDLGEKLTRGNEASPDEGSALVRLDFSAMPPSQNYARLFIPLSIAPVATPQQEENVAPSVASTLAVPELTADLQRTNQFSIRVVLEPAGVSNASGRIVSISQPSGLSDLYLRQENANLVFGFRNPLSVDSAALAWTISNVLVANQPRDLLFSYDGSELRLYADGRRLQEHYMGPGAALAELLRRVKPGELNGYKDIYYAAVFLPVGFLLAIAVRKVPWRLGTLIPLSLSLLVGPILLEWMLTRVNGRSFSAANCALSTSMVIAGIFWINADAVSSGEANRGDTLF
jgi:glycopeptide antibiotics resistance protein